MSIPREQFRQAKINPLWVFHKVNLAGQGLFAATHTCLYMWGAKYETIVAGLVSGEGSQLISMPTWFMLCYSNICSVYAVSLGYTYYLLRNLHSRGWL